jgi:signal transduction histidine kinase
VDASQSTAEIILAAITEAVASGGSLEEVLTGLAETARQISGATYSAIGIPEPEGDAFAAFIHIGMSDELVAQMGPLPRTHGMLDAMLHDPDPVRLPDIKKDRRFRGWWPRAHPLMSSFLGVPIVSEGEVVGAFYLTDKIDAPEFTDEDQAGIVLLASHAAAAIEAAAMLEDSRALAMSEERERLARELHDALNQSLFSLSLTARAAARHLATDPDRAAEELNEIADLSRQAMTELRAVVDGLRTPDVDRDGLLPAIRSLADPSAVSITSRSKLSATASPTSRDAPSTRCSVSCRRRSPMRCGTLRQARSPCRWPTATAWPFRSRTMAWASSRMREARGGNGSGSPR